MQQSIESDTTERLNKGWDLVGPGDMPTKGSDVVTPSHTGGRSSVGRAARDREQQGPQGGRPPPETHRTLGSAAQSTVPTPYAGGTQPGEQTGGRGRTQTGADPGERGLRGQWVWPDGGGSAPHGLHPAGREELHLQSPRCQTQGAGG